MVSMTASGLIHLKSIHKAAEFVGGVSSRGRVPDRGCIVFKLDSELRLFSLCLQMVKLLAVINCEATQNGERPKWKRSKATDPSRENGRLCYPGGCSSQPCLTFITCLWGDSLQLSRVLFLGFLLVCFVYGSGFYRNLIFHSVYSFMQMQTQGSYIVWV